MGITRSIFITFTYIACVLALSYFIFYTAFFELLEGFWLDHYLLIIGIIQLILMSLIIGFSPYDKEYNRAGTDTKWFIFAFILGGAFVWIQAPLNWVYNFVMGTDYTIIYDFDLSGLYLSDALATIFIIPIAEELLFRYHIQKKLHGKYSPLLSIVLASILFASIHLPFYELIIPDMEINFSMHHAYITFFGGLISGFIFYKSKSVFPSIIMHMMWNLFACFA